MPYSDEIKTKALRLYMDRVPMSEIASRPEMPSRPTLYKWKSDGELTDGQDWEQYREEQETEVLRESMDEDMGEWDRMSTDIDEVIAVTFRRLKSGKMRVKATDLKHLLNTKAQIEKKQRQHEREEWRRKVAKKVVKSIFVAFRGEMRKDQFDAAIQTLKEEEPDLLKFK